MRRSRIALAVLAIGVLARPAAAESADAAQLLEQGMRAFDEGALERAISVLGRARAARGAAPLRASIDLYLGLCHAADNRLRPAREYLRQALLADPTLRLDPRRHKPELIRLLEAVRDEVAADLHVTTDVTETQVLVDGEPRGAAPFRGRLAPGWHEIALRAPDGTVTARRRVQLAAGQRTVVELLLLAEGRRAHGSAAPHTAPSSTAAPAPPSPRRTLRLWGIVSGAAAVAGVATAVGLGLRARSDRDQACALLATPPEECASRSHLLSEADRPRYRELYDSARSKALVANILFAVAGGLGVTSAVLSFIGWRRPAAEVSVSVVPGPAIALTLRR